MLRHRHVVDGKSWRKPHHHRRRRRRHCRHAVTAFGRTVDDHVQVQEQHHNASILLFTAGLCNSSSSNDSHYHYPHQH
jgi:hypothetical protein